MGIKFFFSWFKKFYNPHLKQLKLSETFLNNSNGEIRADNLLIDCNGIFHPCAQKIYEYGAFSRQNSYMGRQKPKNTVNTQIAMFNEVCKYIENIVRIVQPSKRLILCVDGVAPQSKQNQQRQRRFKASLERQYEDDFDSNALTPGTTFMDHLTKYIDWYIRKKIGEDDYWKSIEVVFSNEKQPGEGEHKLLNYIRFYGDKKESFCINGMDSDLIMLALGSFCDKFYILRENMQIASSWFVIDIGSIRNQLSEGLKWDSDKYEYDFKCSINDFIFMCFLVGNDFLPHIPSLDIFSGGIEMLISIYKCVCAECGHLTFYSSFDRQVTINKLGVRLFLSTIGNFEKEKLSEKVAQLGETHEINGKLDHTHEFFPDPLLYKCATRNPGVNVQYTVDIDKYKALYYSKKCKIDTENINSMCASYLEGMQWVLSYYTRGCPNWTWFYPYDYAPFASDLANTKYKLTHYGKSAPVLPFQQLIGVLPPRSSKLLPSPLDNLLTSPQSKLYKYYPRNFEIDYDGKRRDFEGIVKIPYVDLEELRKEYLKIIQLVDKREMRRNIKGIGYIYKYDKNEPVFDFNSFYGDLKCKIKIQHIEI